MSKTHFFKIFLIFSQCQKGLKTNVSNHSQGFISSYDFGYQVFIISSRIRFYLINDKKIFLSYVEKCLFSGIFEKSHLEQINNTYIENNIIAIIN